MQEDWRKEDLKAAIRKVGREGAGVMVLAWSVPAVLTYLLPERVSFETLVTCTTVAVAAALIHSAICGLRADRMRLELLRMTGG